MSYDLGKLENILKDSKKYQFFENSQNLLQLEVKQKKLQKNNIDTCYSSNQDETRTNYRTKLEAQLFKEQITVEDILKEITNQQQQYEEIEDMDHLDPQKIQQNQQYFQNHIKNLLSWTLQSYPFDPINYANSQSLNDRVLNDECLKTYQQSNTQPKNVVQQKITKEIITPLQENGKNKIEMEHHQVLQILPVTISQLKNKKSISSLDTHHVVKNFIQFFCKKLVDEKFLVTLKQIFKSKSLWNDNEQQQKVQSSNLTRNKEQNDKQQQHYFKNYLQATKQLLNQLIYFKGTNRKSYSWSILSQLTFMEHYQDSKIIEQEIKGNLIKQVIKSESSQKGKNYKKWVYKNQSYYQITRRVMMWLLRKNFYNAHIMESPDMNYKMRNLKYVKRWIYQLKFPQRCSKLYAMEEEQYFKRQRKKSQKQQKKRIMKDHVYKSK